jgi:hypothetical protein
MIEIIRRRRNVWAGEQNVCFGQFIVYIIPSGFPSVLASDNFFVESYFHTFLSKSDIMYRQRQRPKVLEHCKTATITMKPQTAMVAEI